MLSPISLWKHLTFTLVDSDDSLESLQPLISPLWSLRVKLKRHIACICVLFGSSFCCCFVFVLLLLLFCFRVLFYKTFAIACLCVEPERKAFKTLEFLVSLHCDIVQCEIVVVWYHYVVTLLHCGNFQLLFFLLSLSAEDSRPVMIWIHGGSYHSGYSQKYSAWKVATEQDVVVVVVQYRLGALGFLSSGDSTLPGAYSMTMMVVKVVMIVM